MKIQSSFQPISSRVPLAGLLLEYHVADYWIRSVTLARILITGFVLAIAASLPAFAAAPDGDLIVEASGFSSITGHAVAKLFLPGDNVLDRGKKEVKATIRNGRALFSFAALAKGDYAVVVFHDVNDNGVIDHYWFKLPKEPLGFSNGFSIPLFSGLPTFEKLRFTHGETEQTISVTVR
ncbi:DUF2141 domain-containing protein [Collimonas silvisoli]|uniref:DUF2141 domain-containing protein n=1 Tax=Collimonas silvisoli TaxID=2825884 RepID=UPI001B8B2677|nr:DUF2141 domain-containing protein [Collimonas silvisoli]